MGGGVRVSFHGLLADLTRWPFAMPRLDVQKQKQNCTFLLYCATPPEIEAATCLNLAFGPFNGNYPQLLENMAQAGLDPEGACWAPP